VIRLHSGAATLVGQVRSANEDAHLVADDLVAVADGMGGHRAGEVASAATVQVLETMVGHRSLADLVLAVHMANRTINDRAADDDDLRGMGTTVCVVGVVDEDGEHVAVLNVGDSRVYLFADGELRQLTEDHSLVETLVREGRITPEEAEVHPQRNVLTRALGVEALVVVDAWLLAPRDGDRLLLCSDGLFNELDDGRIAELLAEADEPTEAASRLAAEADAAGGRDNITAVVVDVLDVGGGPEPLDGRYRRIATPTVDLDDHFHDPTNDTATVPLVPISPMPSSTAADGDAGDDEEDDGVAGSDDPTATSGTPEDDAADDDSGAAAPLGPSSAAGTEDGDRDDPDDGDGKRRSWRTPAFVLAVLVVVVAAFGIVVFNAGQGYFVGNRGDEVVILRGQPDGFLWVQPQVVRTSDVELSELSPKQQADIEGERRRFDELAEAERYLGNLEDSTTTTTTTSTTSTTTTTRPTTTSTTAPPTTTSPPPPTA
jgi:protein phosphatase